MSSADERFTHAAAPVRSLLALTASCAYLLKRRAPLLRSCPASTPLANSLLSRRGQQADAAATPKRATAQNTASLSQLQRAPAPYAYDVYRFCTALAAPPFGRAQKCLLGAQGLSLHALLQRRHLYWPPPKTERSKRIKLPSGKKCFVFNAKREQDGKLEPVVCFVDSQDGLLMWLDQEEFLAFESLIPRLLSYYELWEAKAAQVENADLEAEADPFPSPGLD